MKRGSKGFTLIELLIVVAIIGIIAAIAIPNLLYAIDKSRQRATMADIKQLSTAINQYMIENNNYPTTTDINDLAEYLEPRYLQRVPVTDGWTNALVVSSGPRLFTICSNGKDGMGVCETEALGPIDDFDASLTLVNGQFVSWPEGEQQ
jgi:type II secretion system protein G